MKLTNKTQTDRDIEMLESAAAQSLRSIAAAMEALNRSYHEMWGLPDDRLQALLQQLVASGKLLEVFEKHYATATALNTALDVGEYGGGRAIAVAGREFTISTEGVVSMVPLPEPVIEEIPEEILEP